jgi:iron(III) transport system substrate-binding protein
MKVRAMARTLLRRLSILLVLGLLGAGCSGDDDSGSSSSSITVYTCVDDSTIQAVRGAFEDAHPDVDVQVFRAPTGDLNARIASEARSGGLKADVVWACDPLTMQGYVDQDLVGGWTPEQLSGIPAAFRTPDYVGVAVLYLVAIYHDGAPAPKAWSDLTDPQYADAVAVPDPSVAASALGAVGYFAHARGYGLHFYQALKSNGAVQVSTPDDVTTGVAQGVYQAGITIANSAYLAQEDGSPVEVVWPRPGAVGVYGPIALATDSADSQPAKDFISYVVSRAGQTTIGEAGSYPSRADVPRPKIPASAPIQFPDWHKIGADKDALLASYSHIFGG